MPNPTDRPARSRAEATRRAMAHTPTDTPTPDTPITPHELDRLVELAMDQPEIIDVTRTVRWLAESLRAERNTTPSSGDAARDHIADAGKMVNEMVVVIESGDIYRVVMERNHQQFTIEPSEYEDREEALWMRNVLRTFLARIIQSAIDKAVEEERERLGPYVVAGNELLSQRERLDQIWRESLPGLIEFRCAEVLADAADALDRAIRNT